MRFTDAIAAIEERAQAAVHLHAVDLATGREIGHRADDLVVTASTFKLPVLVEAYRQADAGELDLDEAVHLPAGGRTPGPTGLSVMADAVTISWRDLLQSMIVVSDNAATDVVCRRVDLDRVNATTAALGLTDTHIPYDCQGLFDEVIADLGLDGFEQFPVTPTAEQAAAMRALRPVETMHTTARDMTRLVSLVVDGGAASPQACAAMTLVLARQVWPHRLAAGFPEDDVTTGGKTGTLLHWHNEVGFVTGALGRFAVAVFTRAATARAKLPASDAAIGAAARAAVDELRR